MQMDFIFHLKASFLLTFLSIYCELWEGGGELFINLGILFLITNKPGKFSFQTSYLHFLALLYVYVIH